MSSCGGKRERKVFLCWATVRVKVESKVTPTSFPKIEMTALVGMGEGRKGLDESCHSSKE